MHTRLIVLDRTAGSGNLAGHPNYSQIQAEPFLSVDVSVSDRKLLIANNMLTPNLPCSDKALGRALSHISLWSDAVRENRPVTVIEDGATLCANFREASERVIAMLPEGWEYVMWGCSFDAPLTYDMLSGLSPCPANLDQAALRQIAGTFASLNIQATPFRLVQGLGAVAYSVSPAGALRLLDFCTPLRPMTFEGSQVVTSVRSTGIDDIMSHAWSKLAAYVAIPPLAVTNVGPTLATPEVTGTVAASIDSQDDAPLRQKLCSCFWEYREHSGAVIASAIQFSADGRVAGYLSGRALNWRLQDGCLELLSSFGIVTTQFSGITVDADGRLELSGRSLTAGTGHVVLLLREGSPLPAVVARTSLARRNLVVMRAGNTALFPTWPTAPSRSWDLAISFYGEGEPDWGQEYFVAEKGPKWRPIHRWLTDNLHLLKEYDYVWFPDDDIMTDWETVNRFFQICRTYDLQLVQPALTHESYITHAITRQQTNCLLRFTAFVEVMVPAFRVDALRLCMPVMSEETRYGWGHDWVFPMVLDYPANKIAIVDACAVTHTRPAFKTTDGNVARAELRSIREKYKAEFMDHRVRGCIFKEPLPGHFEP